MENQLPSYTQAKNTVECRCSGQKCSWNMNVCGQFEWEQPGFEWYSPLVFLSQYKTQAAQFINDPVALHVTEVSNELLIVIFYSVALDKFFVLHHLCIHN